VVRALLERLISATPGRLSIHELAADQLPVDQLAPLLLHAVMSGVVEIHASPAPFTTTLGERPLASPLARLQVQGKELISTCDHRCISIADEVGRGVLIAADGTRTVSEIAAQVGGEEATVLEHLQLLARQALLLRA
jgi:hypothetical protein